MAQQVEHVLGKDEVAGSNPAISSKNKGPHSLGSFIFRTDLAGFEGGGVSESERFANGAGEKKQERKLHQPCGLCTGARRQRRKSRYQLHIKMHKSL